MKLGTAAVHPAAGVASTTDALRLPASATDFASGILGQAHRFWADHLATLEWARLDSAMRRDVGDMPTDFGAAREHDRATISAWVS